MEEQEDAKGIYQGLCFKSNVDTHSYWQQIIDVLI